MHSVTVSEGQQHPAVTLADLRRHCRIDGDEHDATLLALSEAAEDLVQSESRRILVPQTIEYSFDCWPGAREPLILPRTPLLSVDAIEYVYDGEIITIDESEYVADRRNGRIIPASSWPTSRITEPVVVRYLAGYGVSFATADDVVLTLLPHREWQEIRVSQGVLPSPLSADTIYYTSARAAGGFRLALSPGDDPIDIADSEGPHYITTVPRGLALCIQMLTGHWLEHPEAMGQAQELPWAITRLLESFRPGDDFAWFG